MFSSNIFNYINKYGNQTFEEKEFNEIDNAIFSLLSYLDYSELNLNERLEVVGKDYLNKHKLKEIAKHGFSAKDAYKVLSKIVDKRRYKNVELKDYEYNNNNMQFKAITFKINNKLNYISFSGTDQYIDSWKESFYLLASFLVPAHYEAIKYVNKHVKLLGPKVIIGGHSKGGNLALISSIYLNGLKKYKIVKIYNNDGPGLRVEEFKSRKYKRIKKKYIQIIPHNSIYGLYLRNDNHYVIKSSRVSFFSHSISTWCVRADRFAMCDLSKKHDKLEDKLLNWIDNHSEEERKKIVDDIFETIEKCEIEDTMNLKKIKNIIKVIKELKHLDDETKELVSDFITSIFKKSSN